MLPILKQTSWLVSAQILSRILGFFYTIFLAGNLGVLDFGLYSVGLAYFSIISSIADFGFNRYLIKEISAEKGKIWELIWNLVILRLTVICCFFAALAVFLYVFDQDKMRVSVILLAALAVLPQTVAVTFDGIFIALQKLQFSAISAFISSLTTVLAGLFLITWGFAIFGAINAVILGQLVLAAVLIGLLYKNEGIKLATVKLSILKKTLKGSLPYGILAILGLLYFRIDTVMLSYMRGNFETGIYAAGYKFIEALIFIPNALSFALFPRFVGFYKNNPRAIKITYHKIIRLMFFWGWIIAAAYFLILPEIIKIVLPQFSGAVEVIKILAFSIPFIFLYVPLSQIIQANDKYLKPLITLSIYTLVFNIILSFMLITRFGFTGAAIATVVSDVLSLTVIMLFVQRKIFKEN